MCYTVYIVFAGGGVFLMKRPFSDTMQIVGTVTKAVDELPTQNFESAVTAVGSEIYYSENMPGRIIVKEGDSYSTYWLQSNSQ